MLVSINYEVNYSLLIKLAFDDERVKRLNVEVGDYICCTYNKDGMRKKIEGYVKRIFLDNRYHEHSHHHEHWSMIIDSSTSGGTPIDKVEVSRLLDIDVLSKKSQSDTITTPIGEDAITNFRLVGNTLQLSQDQGLTWLRVCDLPVEEPAIDDCNCDLKNKIESLVPSDLRADKQKELMEGIAKLIRDEQSCNCDCHDDKRDPEDDEDFIYDNPHGYHKHPSHCGGNHHRNPKVQRPVSTDFVIDNNK